MGNILVCDDERSICEVLDIALRREGHRVETVTSGELAKGKIDGALYDVIITDIKMPNINGIEVLRYAHMVSPDSAVILITAVDDFDAAIVAKYGQEKRKRLLADAKIVRNRLKIEAAIENAKAFMAVQGDIGTFDKYIWGFVGHEPRQNAWKTIKEVPAKTPESDAMSKDLKRRGFTFVGSTICYAFMQAVGMVNASLASRCSGSIRSLS